MSTGRVQHALRSADRAALRVCAAACRAFEADPSSVPADVQSAVYAYQRARAEVAAADACCPPDLAMRGNDMVALTCHCGAPSVYQSGDCRRCGGEALRRHSEATAGTAPDGGAS